MDILYSYINIRMLFLDVNTAKHFFFGWLVIWKINISIYSRYCPHGGFKFLITFPYQPMDFSHVGSEQLPL